MGIWQIYNKKVELKVSASGQSRRVLVIGRVVLPPQFTASASYRHSCKVYVNSRFISCNTPIPCTSQLFPTQCINWWTATD